MKFEGKLPKDFESVKEAKKVAIHQLSYYNKMMNQKIMGSSIASNGHWQFPEEMGPPFVGFIYALYDPVLHRAYLGKKAYLGTGVKNRGKDSGWRNYVSSSNLLKELFQHRPVSEFEFICIEQYKTKGTLSYAETWSLCMAEAPTSKLFYNTRIESVSWSVKEPISERHKERLSMIIKIVKENNE
jgi:hypothetical protein